MSNLSIPSCCQIPNSKAVSRTQKKSEGYIAKYYKNYQEIASKMICRSVISFLILVFTSLAIAAPPSNSKWQNIAKQKQFQNYRDTLLSEKVLPFLTTCYNPTCCVNGDADDLSCSMFFDIVTWAQASNYSGSVTKVDTDLIESAPISKFCPLLSSAFAEITEKYHYELSPTTKSLSDVGKCMLACGNVTNMNTRAPCSVSLWLMSKIANRQLAPESVVVANSEIQSENAAVEDESVDSKGIKKPLPPDTLFEKPKLQNESVPADQTSIKTKIQIPSVAKPEEINAKEAVKHETPSNGDAAKLIPTIPGTKLDSKTVALPPVIQSGTSEKSEKPTESKAEKYHKNIKYHQAPEAGKPLNDVTPSAASVDAEKKDKIFEPDTEDYDLNQPDPIDESNQDTDDSLTKVDNSDIGQSERMSQSVSDTKEVRRIIVDPFKEEPSSNFFYYFLFGMFACITGYVVYNNKSKILALILEGRRSQPGRGGRRKHTAAYRKLDSNLEEAIMSAPSGRSTQVIY